MNNFDRSDHLNISWIINVNHIAMEESNESVCTLHFRKCYTVLNVQSSLFRSFVWTICDQMHKFCKTICVDHMCMCNSLVRRTQNTNDFPVDFTDAKMKNLQKRISNNNKLNLRNLDLKKKCAYGSQMISTLIYKRFINLIVSLFKRLCRVSSPTLWEIN